MAYTEEDKNEIIDTILDKIENGMSSRKAVEEAGISSKTFWSWIDKDDERGKQYAHACEQRTELKFESIEEDYSKDPTLNDSGNIDPAWVALQRLKIDAKKWELSKLNPKKYGEKIDLTSKGEKLEGGAPSVVKVEIVRPDFDD